MTWLSHDPDLVAEIAANMDLRRPNAEGLDALAEAISLGDGREVIADLATGVGKTYLAAGLVDYLARQGVRNILIVTPGATIQRKTIRNFTPGDAKYVPGAAIEPLLVTPDTFERGLVGDALHDPNRVKLFVFTVQTLISPTLKATRRAHEENEAIGGALYEHLQRADDLVVIVDEHHVIREKAKRFNSAVHDLGARAVVGLTATPDDADVQAGKVVYQYSLARAIADRLVKVPVIVYRQDGRKDYTTQLRDACLLRERKEPIWAQYAEAAAQAAVKPVLFVVCQTIADANETADALSQDGLLPGDGEVLVITGESSDAALSALESVEDTDSPVRAIVSVDKLKEGWDVRNIGVIVARRALASQTLTEQILGRGLRLPFGRRTDVGSIDQVDIVAHEAYAELLRGKDALLQKFRDSTPSSVAAPAPAPIGDGPLDLAPLHGTNIDDAANGFVIMETEDDASLGGLGAAEILLAQEMGAQEQQLTKDKLSAMDAMPQNDYPPFQFPLSVPKSTPAQFSLTSVSGIRMEQQGMLFRKDATVKLVRRAIDAQLDIHGQVQVIDRLVQSEDAYRVSVHGTAIRAVLLSRIVNSGLIEPNLDEQLNAVELVDRFLAGAGIDRDEAWEWSADHAARAEAALFGVIRAAVASVRSTTTYRWERVRLPAPRRRPSTPLSVWDEFRAHAWIGPWEKSIDKYASFDSESAEFRLAQKLETFDDVVSWQRIYQHGPAWVAYKAGRYFPDFVVLDSTDVHWVLEAKANKAAVDSVEVQEKTEAAQAWVDRVNASKMFGSWRYRVVTEMQIAAAVSWDALAGA